MKKLILSFVMGAALVGGTAYAAGSAMQLKNGQVVEYGSVACLAAKQKSTQLIYCEPAATKWGVLVSSSEIYVLDDKGKTRFYKRVGR